jgi:hypothetical protein
MRVMYLALAVACAACTDVYSLEPAVADSSAIVDSRLLGNWTSRDAEGKSDSASITELDAHHYRIRYVDSDGGGGLMDGTLARLNERWLLDLAPTDEGRDAIDSLGGIGVHRQLVLTLSDTLLRADYFDGDSLLAFLRVHPGSSLAAVFHGGDVLLTDSTARLFAGLSRYAQRPGALKLLGLYHRP